MAWALATLTWLCPTPTQAQGYPGGGGSGGYPSASGHWVVTYACDGHDNHDAQPQTTWDANGDAYPLGSGGPWGVYKANTAGSVTATLTWTHEAGQTDATDPAPGKVYAMEWAEAHGEGDYTTYDNQGHGTQHLASLAVNDGFSDPLTTGNDLWGCPNAAQDMQGSHLQVVNNSAHADVVPLLAHFFTAAASWSYDPHASGYVYACVGYGVQIANVSISASIARGTLTVDRPDYQEWNAYLKQDYKLNANNAALEPFWVGAGSYSAAAKVNGNDVFADQQYTWTVNSAGYPYIPQPHTDDDALTYLPAGSVPSKTFWLDFGTYATARESTVSVTITGKEANTPNLGPAKVKVTWYLPRWFVTKPAPVTTVTGPHDPDKPTGPAEPTTNPDDPDYLEMQAIATYMDTRKQVIHTGALLVGMALQAEMSVAEFYATGPLADMSVAALGSGIGKATEALKGVADAQRTLRIAAEYAAEADRIAAEGKAAGKSAEEIKAMQEMAESFRTGQEVKDAQAAVDKANEMERIMKEACEAKAAKDPHYAELGGDITGNGQFRWNEAETGSRLEQYLGRPIQRSTNYGDWNVDGKIYDAVGCPAAYFDSQWGNLQSQIINHLGDYDRVVFDTTYLDGAQAQQVKDFINALSTADRMRVIVF